MGQKVNPINFRIGVTTNWKSRWFAEGSDYKKYLLEDSKLRTVLDERYKIAGVDSIEIERLPKAIMVKLSVSRPGIVIGRGGSGIEDARNLILKTLNLNLKNAPKIDVQVEEVKNADLSAKLVAQRIVSEMERRMPHRRVVTRIIDRVMSSGAKGIKVALAGRIEGADIARKEKFKEGSVPTQSLRANIDYAEVKALLKRGYVGVKVWIYAPVSEN